MERKFKVIYQEESFEIDINSVVARRIERVQVGGYQVKYDLLNGKTYESDIFDTEEEAIKFMRED